MGINCVSLFSKSAGRCDGDQPEERVFVMMTSEGDEQLYYYASLHTHIEEYNKPGMTLHFTAVDTYV